MNQWADTQNLCQVLLLFPGIDFPYRKLAVII